MTIVGCDRCNKDFEWPGPCFNCNCICYTRVSLYKEKRIEKEALDLSVDFIARIKKRSNILVNSIFFLNLFINFLFHYFGVEKGITVWFIFILSFTSISILIYELKKHNTEYFYKYFTDLSKKLEPDVDEFISYLDVVDHHGRVIRPAKVKSDFMKLKDSLDKIYN